MSNDRTGRVVVTSTATQLIPANARRQSLLMYNGSSTTLYVGPTSSITTLNSIALQGYSTYTEDDTGTKIYTGDFYGITASGTTGVQYWERII